MDIESRPMDESYSYMLDFLKNLKDNNKGIGNILIKIHILKTYILDMDQLQRDSTIHLNS